MRQLFGSSFGGGRGSDGAAGVFVLPTGEKRKVRLNVSDAAVSVVCVAIFV